MSVITHLVKIFSCVSTCFSEEGYLYILCPMVLVHCPLSLPTTPQQIQVNMIEEVPLSCNTDDLEGVRVEDAEDCDQYDDEECYGEYEDHFGDVDGPNDCYGDLDIENNLPIEAEDDEGPRASTTYIRRADGKLRQQTSAERREMIARETPEQQEIRNIRENYLRRLKALIDSRDESPMILDSYVFMREREDEDREDWENVWEDEEGGWEETRLAGRASE
ncbi:hypothetical protein DFP72DRAFT_234030 [Ephemerocybe angulata]|uniref:Uncharacterized protein n=1 Tax=Ephemerocybe angulata TaxID=980116 RepID=A0A8H6I4W8_9AGAR|nr:hypothetical protein DFP72DRAFT_234030 [Tulosesus angulatus]